MLQTALIQNFQKHNKLRVDFDPRITTIVGPTDAGKSSILRAVRWVCLNQPQGDGYIKDGEPGATVQLLLDGHKVGRKRSCKGDNLYLLDGEEFRSFGSSVPDSIAKILNVGPVNFLGQMDGMFWFSESASEVSRQLNQIVDLGIIDESLSSISKKVRHYQATVQVTQERLTAARAKRAELEWVEQADKDYQHVEALQTQTAEIRATRLALANTLKSTYQLQDARAAAISQRTAANTVGKLGQAAKVLGEQRQKLKSLLTAVQEQQGILARGVPDMTEIEFVLQTYNEARRRRLTALKMVEDLNDAIRVLQTLKARAAEAEDELHKATEGRCPVCGKEMASC